VLLEALREQHAPTDTTDPAGNTPAAVSLDFDTLEIALPVHSLRLRHGCTLRMALPSDLSQADVDRIYLFLQSLVEEPTEDQEEMTGQWPYSGLDDDSDTDTDEKPRIDAGWPDEDDPATSDEQSQTDPDFLIPMAEFERSAASGDNA
jgi:hypothetical protein